MGGGSSNKPIVFVFGAKKGDADGRKRNLSAINTQVAYRAHERRREKKNRQRAQAKEDEKVDQQVPPNGTTPSTFPSVNNVDASVLNAEQAHQQVPENATLSIVPQVFPSSRTSFDAANSSRSVIPLIIDEHKRPQNDRRESDLSSEVSSDHDAVFSTSPSSNRHSSPATDPSSLSPPATGHLNAYLEKALDPFFKLPTIASEREKWLVHFYFREMGHIGFGTHNNSLFCPDRDWVSNYVSSKSLCFQWVLILAEEHLGRLGVLPDQTNTLERKAKAYGHLNSILKSDTIGRDEGISGIMYAAIVDTARTNMHLMALDRFIKQTGGFEAFLDGPLGIAHPEHIATVYAFGQCPVSEMNELEIVRDRFLDALRELHTQAQQEQEEKKRIRNRRPWDTLSRQVLDANGTLVPSNHDEHFRYYVKAQQDCFSSDCLSPLLNSILNLQADYASQARHVATLVQTSFILHEFEDNYLARAMFLKRLKYVTEMSTARDPITGMARLSHAGTLLINSYVRQEVQTYFDRTKLLAKGVNISRIVIDFLKIFPLLQLQTRSLIVSCLRDWLCCNDRFEDANFAHLRGNDLTMLSDEITNSWVKSMRRGS